MANKKQIQKYLSFIEDGELLMECKKCGYYIEVSEDAVSVICSDCVQRICLAKRPELIPELDPKKKKTGRPIGWHFMGVFVDKDGTVFHRGKEQPDLKGTLPATKVKPVKKKAKVKPKEKDIFELAKEYKRKQKIKKKK
ncbi:MAG: IBR domain-containing protein [Pelagibacterales bacterium]|nr:IBR domain-containing protein [Pelagibacterales bacterium]